MADAVSRRPDFVAIVTRGQEKDKQKEGIIKGEWGKEYEQCKDFQEVWKQGGATAEQDNNGEGSEKAILCKHSKYQREADYLWVRTKAGWKVCVPGEVLRKEILEHFHDHLLAGHPGIDRTRLAVRSLFWWPRMDADIEMFVKSCVQCPKGKNSHLKSGGLLQPLPIPSLPWEEISVDLIVRLPVTEEKWDAMLTIVCTLTKMAHFIPTTQSASAEDIARIILKEVIRLHGVPKAILSDWDKRFTGDLWRSLCEMLKIRQRMSTAYHPQTDGQSERTNQTIEQMLRCALLGDDKRWGKVLPLLKFAYNSTQHSSSKQAPFELLYGFVPPKPICQKLSLPTATAVDLLPFQANLKLELAKRELLKVQQYQKKYADQHRRPGEFKEGQMVWLKTTNLPGDGEAKALRDRNRGPFKFLRMIAVCAAFLELPASFLVHPVFHVSLLSPVHDEPPHLRRSPPTQDPVAGNEYVIEAVLAHREGRGRNKYTTEFQVKWLDETLSWEPGHHLANAQESNELYFRGIKRQQRGSQRNHRPL